LQRLTTTHSFPFPYPICVVLFRYSYNRSRGPSAEAPQLASPICVLIRLREEYKHYVWLDLAPPSYAFVLVGCTVHNGGSGAICSGAMRSTELIRARLHLPGPNRAPLNTIPAILASFLCIIMICTTCYCMLRGQTGRQWRGSFDIHFSHHPTSYSLELSAAMSCCICRIIWDELTENGQGAKLAKLLQKDLRMPSDVERLLKFRRTTSGSELQVQFLRAFLSEVQGGQDNEFCRLDFRLVDSDTKILATFLLKKSSEWPRQSPLGCPLNCVIQ
jgi:hypothetical protein